MFATGGTAYVFRIYGIHACLNVVTGEVDHPAAVLLRATEAPIEGRSASGPGRLCRAFEIDPSLDGASFLGPTLWIAKGEPLPDSAVRRTARIGVDYAGRWARRRLRWVIRGHEAASGPRYLR
jgi:DNA-3-methyladenine glycosylase